MGRKGPVGLAEFKAVLRKLKTPTDQRFGVGVTGDAKSMAALLLLREAVGPERVTAFTVDHRLKPGSREEAQRLHKTVTALGVRHEILTADWTEYETGLLGDRKDPPIHNPDQLKDSKKGDAARARRHTLLAKACRHRGIPALIFGHSLDDQIRIGLKRMSAGSGIEGLSGMKMLCSEVPNTFVPAAKKVQLLRPLLCFDENRLVETCTHFGAPIHNGPTNDLLFISEDVWLSLYLRKLVHADGDRPDASPADSAPNTFDKDAFAHFMALMNQHREAYQKKVRPILDEYTLFDPPSGTCFLQVRPKAGSFGPPWIKQPHIALRVLSRVIQWCARAGDNRTWTQPTSIPLDILSHFNRSRPDRDTSVGHVQLCRPRANATGAYIWLVGRARMQSQEQRNTAIVLKLGDTALWDARFLIALQPSPHAPADTTFYGVPPRDLRFVVRALTTADMKSVINRMRIPPHRGADHSEHVQRSIMHYQKKVPESLQETIPCIALEQDDGDRSYVVAIPSLSINLEPEVVDVRFSFANHGLLEREERDVGFSMLEEQEIGDDGGGRKNR
ncbi:uncharacterized protein EV422DRAFT_533988 [Fimicolochytrium jonesii]|uniref:uncharacterized protein n=1 Tax=Fimicolochytrium jonesii TaxID=1396493 RepID=UPI0022FDFED7|nr:uncharacterized protein EV422DRAFT_533988 [Fimicolochytrium jonesii]KAI8819702.1 hypothetical protein EV422DRAFT_533988 [Fimicolochytrium jonesii]